MTYEQGFKEGSIATLKDVWTKIFDELTEECDAEVRNYKLNLLNKLQLKIDQWRMENWEEVFNKN